MAKVTLSELSVAALRKEIARREKQAVKLVRRRKALLKKLAALDAEIGDVAAAPGAKPGRKPGRKPGPKPSKKSRGTRRLAKNAAPLPPSMAAVMSKGASMGVREIMAAVKAAGYKSTSPNFETIVYQALRDPRFKRVARGKYTLS